MTGPKLSSAHGDQISLAEISLFHRDPGPKIAGQVAEQVIATSGLAGRPFAVKIRTSSKALLKHVNARMRVLGPESRGGTSYRLLR